ncbi:hypothetical protein PCA10_15080 [Metapseudomonas resinovorans NBRC 106553]|uniref:Uncharacterized protein n=1 Tax=Metapseudomonas resinovorans NBRC 106553 TaxID=1245471 RepID=S6AGM2_METRE|nr:hypothetical protein PCA10_15080 [Pseudomonas resinovorans NBRC 106553]
MLLSLRDSELSGTFSAYNLFLQSAIDAGTLAGADSTVGGQVHADATSYLLRQGALIDRTATGAHVLGPDDKRLARSC